MNILVVEDQDSIRNMIEALVRARGFSVTAVSSGMKALDIAQTAPPDLVLLDLMMPGKYDGIEVCERLRADPTTKNTPVVIISAVSEEAIKEKAVAAGATAYYTKPFSPMALLSELDRLKQQVGA